MNIPLTLAIGAVLGFLGNVGVYFEPQEPDKPRIVAVGTIRGLLTALLAGFSLTAESGWLAGLGFGVLYGVALGVLTLLARTGPLLHDAKFVMPTSTIVGGIAGVLITWLAF